MTLLSDTFYLARAGRYADPLNSNDRLPVVYGDLTDGTLGIWELPCIDVADDVFCYAGHAVLSAANGNSVTIYENDLELDPGMYTFDESDNYEGAGTIATITFSTPKTGSIITARGKGKATGATLIENIIDIVDDFLTVENDFTSDLYDATSKTAIRTLFSAQSYKAAGIIKADDAIWTILMRMMSSFLGSVYMNSEGHLAFDLDTNRTIMGPSAIIRKGESRIDRAVIRLENIINQCPCSYAYNYATNEFKSYTDASSHADTASQAIFGVRKPKAPFELHWCRDLTTVQAVQDIIVEKLKDPLYELDLLSLSSKHPHVELGDIIMYSAERLYDLDGLALLNRYWKVVSLRPDFGANNILFGLVDSGHFYTIAYLADGGTMAEVASGEVDRSDMRLCLADGVAFVGFDGVDLSDYGGVRTGYRITITDSADKESVGYFTTADAAEALGAELVTNGTFDADIVGWVGHAGYDYETAEWDGVGAMHLVNTAGNGYRSGATFAVTSGKLYKVTFDIALSSGALPKWALASSTSGALLIGGYIQGLNGSNTFYVIAESTSAIARFFIYNIAATDFTIDNISVKEVTDVGIDGVHIVSASSGITRNWASIEAGFDYNDTGGYTYKIEAGRLADGSVFAGNNRDTTIY